MTDFNRRWLHARPFIAAIALVTAGLAHSGSVRAAELIPSIGVSKSTDNNAGDAKAFGGVALRLPLLPFLKGEAAIGYRQDSFAGGNLTVRQWPVTASVWASPLPLFYAGGGVGWYRTTFDLKDNALVGDATSNTMGVHLGGGLNIPLAPQFALDVNGRYVFMQADDDNIQVPTTFNPDYWNLGVGLAIKF